MDIIFLSKDEILALHARGLTEHGGSYGIRDEGTLDSAISAPENRAYYENAGLIECAAAYAFHLTQAHAFVDGNKRVAAAVTVIFLRLNGMAFKVPKQDLIDLFMNIGASKLSRDEVEQMLRNMLNK